MRAPRGLVPGANRRPIGLWITPMERGQASRRTRTRRGGHAKVLQNVSAVVAPATLLGPLAISAR
jgi:hypothetical protein